MKKNQTNLDKIFFPLFLGLKLFICIFSINFCWFNLSFALDNDVCFPTNYALYIEDSLVELEFPIILKNNALFMPIRQALIQLKANAEYFPKRDIYEFNFFEKKIKCIVVPYSSEFWIDKKLYFFSDPSFEYEKQIYVPIKDFCNFLGYKFKVDEKKIIIETAINTRFYKNTEIKEDYLFSIEEDINRQLDLSYKLPVFDEDRSQFISFGNNLYNLDKKFFYEKDILYIDLTYILRNEAYDVQINEREDKITIAKNNKNCVFLTKVNDIEVSENQKQYMFTTIAPAKIIDNKGYIPLISFLRAFEQSFYWDERERIFTFLQPISKVKIEENGAEVKIKIFSKNRLNVKSAAILDWPKRLELEIINAKPLFFDTVYNVDQKSLNSFSVNSQKFSTKIAIGLKNKVDYSLIYTPDGLEIVLRPVINSIEQYLENDSLKVIVKGTMPFNYLASFIDKPAKLIIDIPNSVSDIDNFIKAKGNVYQRIRAFEIKKDFPKSRLIFDLNEKIKYQIKQLEPDVLEIKFILPKKAKIKSSGYGLANKLILLDPGHGGRDPGAVSRRGGYEKYYNLDVAKRLQKLLEAEGAIVIMTRTDDETVSLQDRVDLANGKSADVFICIHFNNFKRAYTNGIETYYYKPEDKRLCMVLQKELIKGLKMRNNGVRHARMFVNRYSYMPTALLELGYLSNANDSRKISQPAFRQQIAKAIVLGLKKYYSR